MTDHATTSAGYGADAGMASAGRDALLLAARVLLGAIFVQSGFGKLLALSGFIAGMESQGVPMATIVAPIGALVEAVGGLAIVLGAWTRLAALLVAAFTVVATLIAHRYWDAAPDAMKMQQIQFMKNLAIIGGFLSLVASGGGRFGLDGWRARR
ncbi:DoxX family protein [Azospirillum sp. B510]|uniref:DoxX family protein n=1 Tax=Azospirillum sp. (strain B510) TaxID=137722 RepID=UPI0005A7D375|nr:DoxX family protein [Azospirillum sp. B510]